MNYFEAQDKARRNTSWLVLLFFFAVAALILLTNLLLLFFLTYGIADQPEFSAESFKRYYSWREFAGVSAGVSLLIFGGSFYKIMSLSGGGRTIAEMLGGIVAIGALGLGLMFIGYTGTFFGQWIKAVVSRQREYLADASAV